MIDAISDLSASILLSQRNHKLPVDPLRLKHREKTIIIDSIVNFSLKTNLTAKELNQFNELFDAVTLKNGKDNIVLYNDSIKNCHRRRFSIAHEIGHIYLEHSDDGEVSENQADAFASELLMPRVLIKYALECGMTSDDIRKLFSVSSSACKRKIKGFSCDFVSSKNEQKMFILYKNFITKSSHPIITV